MTAAGGGRSSGRPGSGGLGGRSAGVPGSGGPGVADAATGGGGTPGEWIIRLSFGGTALFTVTAIAGAIRDGYPRNLAAVVAFVLFGAGIVAFFAAYARAVSRSRFDTISVAGLYLLLGSTPRPVQLRLLGSLGVEVVVAVVTSIATASVRPFTPLAFGLLVPMFGLACCGLWAAYHGAFPARRDPRASLPADD